MYYINRVRDLTAEAKTLKRNPSLNVNDNSTLVCNLKTQTTSRCCWHLVKKKMALFASARCLGNDGSLLARRLPKTHRNQHEIKKATKTMKKLHKLSKFFFFYFFILCEELSKPFATIWLPSLFNNRKRQS